MTISMKPKAFASFREFYPFYLSQHSHPVCRQMHVVGLVLVFLGLFLISWRRAWEWIWILPVIGYGFAWVGHFFFEKNKPATFKYPLYSFMGDWVMFYEFLFTKKST